MMKRLSLIAQVIVFAVAVACSDSTGPSAAVHVDQLYQQACRLADTGMSQTPILGSPYYPRCAMFALLLAAPASGAQPSPVQVTTSSGVQTWHAVVIAEADTAPGNTLNDSSFFLVAYADANVTTALVSVFTATSSGFKNLGSAIYTDAPITLSSSANNVVMSTVTTGGPCNDVSGLTNPLGVPIVYAPSVCHLATFNVAISAKFQATPGLDAALETITITPQTVNGIRVINSPVFE
jgi:hypothetical protein